MAGARHAGQLPAGRGPVHPLAALAQSSLHGAARRRGRRRRHGRWRSSARCSHPEIVGYLWIVVAMVVGTAIGMPLSRVPLTAVPQRTALSHAFGGLAAALVGTAKYALWLPEGELTPFRTFAIAIEVILGGLTFTGSLMAAGKLQEIIPTRPITYKGQNLINLSLLAIAVGSAIYLVAHPEPVVAVRHHPGAVAGLRRAADHPDRRRRHADGHLAAQLVRRPGGGGDGLRAREQAADHRRRARRVVGPHPVDHHVQGDEPLVHQRAVRRVRPGAGRERRRRGQDRQERHGARRRGPPRERRHASSSCPATAWRWRRRSTACARSTTS